jgi:hypothetical protein
MQTTVSKAINEWQVIEDNGGGLHLFVYGDGGIDGGVVIYAHSGYEYNKRQLSTDLNDLDAGGDVAGWGGCVEGDLQEYLDSFDDDAHTSTVVAQGADGERRLFTHRMGSATRREFGVGDDE